MGWTNEQSTEIVAPAGTPFLPGNDVIGFGTQLPPELSAYGVTAAIVIYNNGWNASLTTPCVKFTWIGMAATYLCMGLGITANPHTNPVAVVTSGLDIGMFTDGTGQINVGISNAKDHLIWQMQETIGAGDAEEAGFGDAGSVLWDLPASSFPGPK